MRQELDGLIIRVFAKKKKKTCSFLIDDHDENKKRQA